MTSWIFPSIYSSIFKLCIQVLWDMWKRGCTSIKRVLMGMRAYLQKGGKSLTELPSSGGMRHKLTAVRRGFLCSKMQNVHFYEIKMGV